MKKFYFIFMAALAISTTLPSCSDNNPADDPNPDPQTSTEDVQPLPTTESIVLSRTEQDAMIRSQEFAFRLNAKVVELASTVFDSYDGNYSISPLSATIALTLYANSIDEPERGEIVKMLGFDDINGLNTLATKLMQYLPAKTNGIEMRLANSVWHNDKFTVSDSFRDSMSKNFGTPVNALKIPSQEAVNIINGWCNKHTDGMIPSIIEKIPDNTCAMWLNAMFFAGAWESEFDKKATSREAFHGADGETAVDMMHSSINTSYSKSGDLSMVSLPFKGNSYEMYIIMTDNTSGSLSVDTFKRLVETAQIAEVELALPRFTLNRKAKLDRALNQMGFPTASGTFKAMGFPASETINNLGILQNTAINLDEEGAKIAAVTYVGVETSIGGNPQYNHVKFTVDRPFHFVVKNTVTDAIVLMGRINNLPDAK